MRCGTTFLRSNLAQHPDVAPHLNGEGHFFAAKWPGDGHSYNFHFAQHPIRDGLARLGLGRAPLRFDPTPYYLFHPKAPERAAQTLGQDVRMIALLREPGARAWSHYRLELGRGSETMGFVDALHAEKERLAGEEERLARGIEREGAPHQIFSYAARGHYADQLERWFEWFPREQFLILRSQDLFARPAETLAEVCAFLGLAPMDPVEGASRNATRSSPMPEAARAYLDEVFREPNQRLKQLIGIDFAA